MPIETKDFYTQLKRPQDTSLNVWKVKNRFGVEIPNWQNGLKRFFDEIL